MVTRLYLPSTGCAAIDPALGAWEVTTGRIQRKAVTTKIGSSFAMHVMAEQATANQRFLCRQYITDPVSAQTITGTIKGQIRASGGTVSARSMMLVRVVSNNGSTYRGTLLDFNDSPASATFVATLTNRHMPHLPTTQTSITVSAVAALAGDRLVIEIGALHGVGGESGAGLNFGDATSDLPEDLTTVTANSPWVEFSLDLFTAAGGAPAESESRIYLTLRGAGI